jgi:hypothetical protein
MRVTHTARLLLHLLTAGALAATASTGAAPLRAQTAESSWAARGPTWVLQAGQWFADVDGTVGAIRAELPMGRTGRWLFVPGLIYAHYSLGASPTQVDLLAPEALVQLQLGQGGIRPYVGGGAGMVLVNMFHTLDPVVSLGAGVRADLTSQWGARLELDTRAFGQFEAGSLGWSVGVARRF